VTPEITATEQELINRLHEVPLSERLARCQQMIGDMCAEGRPPRMSVPVNWDDEDFYISQTLRDASVSVKQYDPYGD
jgi:hypothetical protein